MMDDHFFKAEFDEYATSYDNQLNRGLFLSGENKDYFARSRITWLANCLKQLREQPKCIMDFGCGIGFATALFREMNGAESIIGIDSSIKSLRLALKAYSSKQTQFKLPDQYSPNEKIDLAYCNGVFHHIPIHKRESVINYIYRSLRHEGLFALWENNPWNPGTRFVMSRIPFDRDAITLSPKETRKLLRSAGFSILRTDFLFIFPKIFQLLRFLEPYISRLPFGAQYQVLCRKI